MTKEDYKKLIIDIDRAAVLETEKVIVRFALQNNTVQIGQTISDALVCVRVESMVAYLGHQGEPMMKYTGHRLTKSGELYKSLEKATIYQCNLQITQQGE